MSIKASSSFTLVLACLLCQPLFVIAQAPVADDVRGVDREESIKDIFRTLRGEGYLDLLERLYGSDAEAAANVFEEGSAELSHLVVSNVTEKTDADLETKIVERKEKRSPAQVTTPTQKQPVRRKRRGKVSLAPARVDWRQLALGFQPLELWQDDGPEIKMTETEKEIKAEGTDKKSFETKDAKGTRTQKAETKYTRDGQTFGVEIKDTQIIEAVSKPDGKSFRKEISLLWGAEVAACPDVNGVTAGTGKAKVIAKTTYSENGSTVVMTSEFELQAKLTGYVNDLAEMTHYDMQIDAYTTNSGYEKALQQNLIKEIKIKDGRYGLHYDIAGNKIEVSDGKYGGQRTPAKMGTVTANTLTAMNDADTTLVGKAIGPMVPSIWNSANEMYGTARKHWRGYGCVEVTARVPKTVLSQGETVSITAETVHLQDKNKVNTDMTAEAYEAEVTPENQKASPSAAFQFTQTGSEKSSLYVESVSKRGIGKGDVEFDLEKEEQTTAGTWSGKITATRKQREEREKRSGANLAENGGHMETTTTVQLSLTGALDRSVDAENAHIANVSGMQELVDHEYDRYKVDEGYCGPNAVPYKGPKEITRTSTTTADYNHQTRVYVEAGPTGGTITFSLPEASGATVHKYVHSSPCAEHDRVNTNQARDEDAPTAGGSFSFSFPIDPSKKVISGSTEVRGEDGTITTYSWELTRSGR